MIVYTYHNLHAVNKYNTFCISIYIAAINGSIDLCCVFNDGLNCGSN